MPTKEIITAHLGIALGKRLERVEVAFFEDLSAIRIRVDKPLLLGRRGAEYTLSAENGQPIRVSEKIPTDAYRITQADINETLERMGQYSLYAFEEELRMGYLTLPGGHRVGITGRTSLERQSVRTLRNINGLHIRVAHQVIGCADTVLPFLLGDNPRPLRHTLLISPPGCGKTTLLRDIIRQISNGVPGVCAGMTVGVVDERSEIAGCYKGVPQNDVGIRTDVLDGCPKAEGMVMLLRAMSPDVIAVDELGGERDVWAVEDVINAGIKLLCTVHGHDLADIRRKPVLGASLDKLGFERFVVLRGSGEVEALYGGGGKRLDY